MTSERIRTMPARGQRRLPIKTVVVELDGDYDGWQFEMRKNPPAGMLVQGLSMVAGVDENDASTFSGSIEGMAILLRGLIRNWNFVDEDGNDMPLTEESIRNLPLDLLGICFSRATDEVQQSPLVSNEN